MTMNVLAMLQGQKGSTTNKQQQKSEAVTSRHVVGNDALRSSLMVRGDLEHPNKNTTHRRTLTHAHLHQLESPVALAIFDVQLLGSNRQSGPGSPGQLVDRCISVRLL